MLADAKIKILLDLVNQSTREELVWMNGYLNGLVKGKEETPVSAPANVGKITIVYGTETGNSKRLATEFAGKAKKKAIHAKLVSLDQYRLTDLPKEEYLLAVISTHGEGEPPIAAKKFYDHIHQNGFKLNRLKYSVLALGDTSYPLFCKTGEDVDEQLNKLGGVRIAPLQKCDVAYEDDANAWFDNVIRELEAGPVDADSAIAVQVPPEVQKKSGKQIYTGTVRTVINLNDRGSAKETYHIEIEAEGLSYQCGDSIGIVPSNPETTVQQILALTGVDAGKKLLFKNEAHAVYNLLRYKLNIIHLTERLVQMYAGEVGQEIPAGKMDLLDLLLIYPVRDTKQFEEILVKLNPISPRLYTIASAPAAHEGEVHIVAVKDVYNVNGQTRFGLCSQYLAELKEQDQQQFFIQVNKRFRLPAPDKDIIMVGPGTGIAPFRSFLAERDATGASGRNWLFFGEQHFTTDFLYQTEIQNWFDTGVLTKVNLAFSRDQQEKIYVQHRMLEHAAELYSWIEAGASFYICGKKEGMSTDVEQTLLKIISEQGNKTAGEAAQYLEIMEEEGRFEKDVY